MVTEYSYYPGLDQPHALIKQPAGSRFYARLDGLGNVIALTNEANQVRRTYTYDYWGKSTGGTDTEGFSDADRARWKGALWLGAEAEERVPATLARLSAFQICGLTCSAGARLFRLARPSRTFIRVTGPATTDAATGWVPSWKRLRPDSSLRVGPDQHRVLGRWQHASIRPVTTGFRNA